MAQGFGFIKRVDEVNKLLFKRCKAWRSQRYPLLLPFDKGDANENVAEKLTCFRILSNLFAIIPSRSVT